MARKQLSGLNQNNTPLTNVPTPSTGGDAANKTYVDNQISNNATPDATSSVRGKLQLSGDLGGTATAPAIKRTIRVTVTRDSTRLADYVCDGTADDVEIQAAVNAVNAAGGGTVELLAGASSYRIASAIVVPENVTVRGERMARQASGGVTLKTAASVNLTDMVQITGTTNPASNADLKHDIVFENITFDGNNTTTNLVKLTNQDTVKFRNCRLIQGTNAIVTVWDSTVDPVAATIPGGVYLDWCNVSANSGIAIDFEFQTQCWISNCWFTGSNVTTWIKAHASNKIHVTNCEFNAATQAIQLSDTATMACNDITVTDSVFAQNSGQKVLSDTRTNAGSTRVYITGTAASGVVWDKPVGASGIYLNDTLSPIQIQSLAAADKTLTLKGAASQSGRYIEVQNNAGTAIAYLNNGGGWFINNGSASTAAYGFTSELSSGMYRPSAGNLGFTVSGTQRLNLSSAGVDALNQKIINVTDPTNPQDVATKAYVDANLGGGSGDVTGPASSTTNTIAVFDGTTGKVIKQGTGFFIDGNSGSLFSTLGAFTVTTDGHISAASVTTTLGISAADVYADTITSTSGAPSLPSGARIAPRVFSTASSATPTFNTDSYDAVSITALATNVTSMTTGVTGTPYNFQKLMIRIKDNGTARSIAWGALYASRGAALPTSTIVNKTLTIGLVWNSVTSTWDCVATAQEV